MPEDIVVSLLSLTYFGFNANHLCSTLQEDSHIADLKYNNKQQALFGVFDGHGGREVATYTEQHYRDFLKDTEAYKIGDLPNALRQSFLKVDEELEKETGKEELAVMKRKQPPNKAPLFKLLGDINGAGTGAGGEQSNEQLQLDSIGCTANVLIIEDMKKIIIANAGDSRCVLGRSGRAVPLSFDHKPDDEIELRRIEKAGSVVTEGRVDGNLNLSRSLGDLKYKINKDLKPEEWPITANPDLKVVDIEAGDDFIIMGCDGIWETKTNEEMVEYIYDRLKQKKEMKTIVEELLYDIISPDYTQTGKLFLTFTNTYRRYRLRQYDIHSDCIQTESVQQVSQDLLYPNQYADDTFCGCLHN